MEAQVFDLRAYAEIVRQELDVFRSNPHEAGEAIRAAILTYHLHEWLWKWSRGGKAPLAMRGQIFDQKAEFIAWLNKDCPHFKALRRLANGSKHADLVSSQKIERYNEGAYGIGPFEKPHLQIRIGSARGANAETLAVESVVCKAAEFLLALVDDSIGP